MGCGSSVVRVDRSTNTEERKRPTFSDIHWHQKFDNDDEHDFASAKRWKFTPKTGFVYKWVSVAQRRKLHEQIARTKKEERSNLDYEKLEEEKIQELGLTPLQIPACNHTDERIKAYTMDDTEHTGFRFQYDCFKYGKQIYSWKKMLPIIQERMKNYREMRGYSAYWILTEYPLYMKRQERRKKLANRTRKYEYPIYEARQGGVSRKELARVLHVCQVGVWVEAPRSHFLQRMKEDVESIFDAPFKSAYSKHGADDSHAEKYLGHFHDQLSRWLTSYPKNNVYNVLPQPNVDPNKQVFPLPKDILADTTILRKWLETWKPFDCELPEDGAWERLPTLNEDWQNAHSVFAELVKISHEDESLEPLDTTIEGDVAWIEIEMDLVKNDITTEAQNEIWKKRAARRHLHDPVRMAERREELATALRARYAKKNKPYHVEDYMNFAEVLEEHWIEFQRICEETPPEHFAPTKFQRIREELPPEHFAPTKFQRIREELPPEHFAPTKFQRIREELSPEHFAPTKFQRIREELSPEHFAPTKFQRIREEPPSEQFAPSITWHKNLHTF